MCALLCGAALVVVADAAHSAEPGGRPTRAMTLDEARAFARSHHLAAIAARQRVLASVREAEAVSSQWSPRAGAFAQIVGATTNNSTTTMLGNAAVDLPRIGATAISTTPDLRPYPSTAVALGVRQELYDFGRIAAERAASDMVTEIERHRAAGVEIETVFAVTQAFYAVRAASAVAEASRSAYQRATTHRDFARANVQSGMRPPIELTRAEADVARYEAGAVRADGSLRVARAVFAAAVGVEDDELDAAGEAAAPAPLPPLDALADRVGSTPFARELRARVEAQKAETRRLDAQLRPNVFATAAVSSRAGGAPPNAGASPVGEGWLPVVPNYDVGVVFSWPILEPALSSRADASRLRETAVGTEASLALRTQRLLVATAYREADVTARTLDARVHGADAAKANYEQAEQRFKVGLGTATELADAQALRTEAEIQLAVGHFEAARARAALDRVVAEVR